MRRGFGEELRLSLKVRIIIIVSGLVLLLAGLIVADHSLMIGIIIMLLGIIVAFIGIGRGGGTDMAFGRGVRDPRSSETGRRACTARENPWDTMGKTPANKEDP